MRSDRRRRCCSPASPSRSPGVRGAAVARPRVVVTTFEPGADHRASSPQGYGNLPYDPSTALPGIVSGRVRPAWRRRSRRSPTTGASMSPAFLEPRRDRRGRSRSGHRRIGHVGARGRQRRPRRRDRSARDPARLADRDVPLGRTAPCRTPGPAAARPKPSACSGWTGVPSIGRPATAARGRGCPTPPVSDGSAPATRHLPRQERRPRSSRGTCSPPARSGSAPGSRPGRSSGWMTGAAETRVPSRRRGKMPARCRLGRSAQDSQVGRRRARILHAASGDTWPPPAVAAATLLAGDAKGRAMSALPKARATPISRARRPSGSCRVTGRAIATTSRGE